VRRRTRPEEIDSQEVDRLRSLLAHAVQFSGSNQRQVEEKLGLSPGTLSRRLNGGAALKLDHIISVCRVIGFPPSRFFRAAYPELEEAGDQAHKLQRLLEQLHPDFSLQSVGAKQLAQEDLERKVLEVLSKLVVNAAGMTT
jgi:transcriptional regulator with XRE-family HTH domain